MARRGNVRAHPAHVQRAGGLGAGPARVRHRRPPVLGRGSSQAGVGPGTPAPERLVRGLLLPAGDAPEHAHHRVHAARPPRELGAARRAGVPGGGDPRSRAPARGARRARLAAGHVRPRLAAASLVQLPNRHSPTRRSLAAPGSADGTRPASLRGAHGGRARRGPPGHPGARR